MGMILINVVVRASVDSCHSIHVCPLFPALHLFCQVLAMDRYPEHLVEASVGDACTLMASIAWFPAQWTWANNNIEHVNRHNGLWYDSIKEHSSLPDSSSVPSFVACLHFRNSFFVFYFLNFWRKNVEECWTQNVQWSKISSSWQTFRLRCWISFSTWSSCWSPSLGKRP